MQFPIARMARRACLAAAFACGIASAAVPGDAARDAPAAALRQKHAELASRLERNAFGRPIHLDSRENGSDLRGDVYAVLAHPFERVEGALIDAASWCELLVLPFNVKRCEASGGGSIAIHVARKAEAPVADAVRLALHYAVLAKSEDHFSVQLDSASGPLGTKNYRIVLAAVPLDSGHTFVHLSYGYTYGTLSRMAMQAYLSTSGADKVGFSVEGRDADGKPQLVGGMRGVLERNTMRYFLAIEAHLEAASLPPPARERRRLESWFAATERYPRQLHEMTREEYLALKQRDLAGAPARTAGR